MAENAYSLNDFDRLILEISKKTERVVEIRENFERKWERIEFNTKQNIEKYHRDCDLKFNLSHFNEMSRTERKKFLKNNEFNNGGT